MVDEWPNNINGKRLHKLKGENYGDLPMFYPANGFILYDVCIKIF